MRENTIKGAEGTINMEPFQCKHSCIFLSYIMRVIGTYTML